MDFEKLSAAVGELDEDTMIEMLNEVMEQGGGDAEQAMEACQKGMDIVGNLRRVMEGEHIGTLVKA